MDLSCIILSGDLELYVLGMLPEEEALQIQQLATIFPEVQSELDRISESLVGIAAASAATPSSVVKENIMNKLRALKVAEEEKQKTQGHVTGSFDAPTKLSNENPLTTVENDSKEIKYRESPVVPMRGTKSNRSSWLTAAAMIGLVLSLGAVIYLVNENKKTKNEFRSLSQRADTLQKNNLAQQQEILAYNQTMQMMQNRDYKKIELANLPGRQEAIAQVLWNTKTHEVFLSDISLPQAPSGKQYQLWAIVDGKPVDAGMVNDAKHVAQKMKTFEKADAFAISIEQKGGNSVPTDVYMMGKT